MPTDTKPQISYHFSSELLIKTCPLPSSMMSRHQHKIHTASASAIEPLSALLKRHKNHLEYNVMEQLIDCIGRQLQSLERENKGISCFHLDDITVFHDTDASSTIHFAITNDDKIHDINEDNNIVITAPYSTSYTSTTTTKKGPPPFHSPEFKEFITKKTIPYQLHFKSGYYSFGLLCMYCYVSRNTTTTLAYALDTIINTKIYWFLKQVLRENPTERRYICV
jgi:hypothetical protein